MIRTIEALDRAGITINKIDFVLPTHLHWDHVCGLLALPGLPVQVSSGRPEVKEWR